MQVKINLKTAILLLGALGSMSARPELLNFLPENWANGLSFLFTAALAFSNALARIPQERSDDAK